MGGMKITLSSAMRARDVSRPQPEHDAAAQAADAAEPAQAGPRATAGAVQRGPAAGAAKTSPAVPGPEPGTAGPAGPAPAGDPVPGPGVRPEGPAGQPAAGGQRSAGSRRHRSRRRPGR